MSTDLDLFKDQVDEDSLLVKVDDYLTSGVHIGTNVTTRFMNPYVYRVRKDGLYILDIRLTDERIRFAAKLLSNYHPEDVLIASARQYGTVPSSRMARICSFISIPGRFVPGTLTNYRSKSFIEPRIILVNDPRSDKQAMSEAKKMNIPVIALCDSDNSTANVDFVIPVNNKGRRSLARLYLLLTQQVLRERGELGLEEEFSFELDDFAFKLYKTS